MADAAEPFPFVTPAEAGVHVLPVTRGRSCPLPRA
jgi:hypothetical protein